ncbi:MAG: hypothetical protein DHS20C05_24470 [Hyphococcus sp.]|nr:MAG: hypothetical protein DHS20C05_24470 [Marinicaulis sp.]
MRDVQFENFRVTILYTFSGLPTQKQALAFHTEAIAEQEYRSFENSAATKPQNSLDEKGVESHFRFQFAEMTRILGKNFIPDRYAKEFHYELFADPFTNGALAPSYLKRQIRAELFRLTTMFGPPD